MPTIEEEELALFLGSLSPDALVMLANGNSEDHGSYRPEGEDEIDPEDLAMYDDAMARSDTPEWVSAIKDELLSISDLKVWPFWYPGRLR